MTPRACSIRDVAIYPLQPHADARGRFTEIFRESWETGSSKVQWNCVQSHPGVLRGVHVHAIHSDYLLVAAGKMILGLHDIRTTSPTFRQSEMIVCDAASPMAIAIPPGVCHGFYFPVESIHIYAVSEYWNQEDELGCHFGCAELGLIWPDSAPRLSERDTKAGDYATMCANFARARTRHSARHE